MEVLGLNLQGTELVSLSACDTAKGVVDYSEGVYGLVRAFRTAGAHSVLMTLRPVGDRSAMDFMEEFYDRWLGSPESIEPAEALHQTRLYFIEHPKKTHYRAPKIWSPYVMVGR
jgi:CHAT domain-containing protein